MIGFVWDRFGKFLMSLTNRFSFLSCVFRWFAPDGDGSDYMHVGVGRSIVAVQVYLKIVVEFPFLLWQYM